VTTPLLGSCSSRFDVWEGPVVDADVHAVVPSVDALFPYLDEVWHQHVRDRSWPGPFSPHYPLQTPAAARDEWRPANGRLPASDLVFLHEHLLDPWDVEVAIVNCYYPIDFGHPDVSAAFAAAVNDWLVAEWLERDSRLRASLVLPGQDPAAMVREVERIGGHPGFVQALLPARSGRMWGNRPFHPVLEAIARHDLVAGIHWGGLNDQNPPTPNGWPSWFIEEVVAEQQVFAAQLTSLIAEGAFQAVPTLRTSMLECGFAWLPSWAWRMDKEWKGMRREIPWVNRPPSALIREHVRFSTAPLDADPAWPDEFARVVGWLGSEELLLFASDYPHAHDDDLGLLLASLPETMRPKVMAENARAWYRL
jgi:predicted TIM-barrel fold metal-dependent hydrolase